MSTKPLSWSELDKFENDFDSWYMQYVIGIKEPPTKPMIRGTDIHRFLQTGSTAGWDKRYTPDEVRVHDKIAKAFQTAFASQEFQYEVRTAAVVANIPTIGFWDGYHESSNAILEIKTGASVWSEHEAKTHGQLAFYAAQAMARGMVQIPEFWLFSASTTNGKTAIYKVNISESQLEVIKSRITNAWAKMDKYREMRVQKALA